MGKFPFQHRGTETGGITLPSNRMAHARLKASERWRLGRGRERERETLVRVLGEQGEVSLSLTHFLHHIPPFTTYQLPPITHNSFIHHHPSHTQLPAPAHPIPPASHHHLPKQFTILDFLHHTLSLLASHPTLTSLRYPLTLSSLPTCNTHFPPLVSLPYTQHIADTKYYYIWVWLY